MQINFKWALVALMFLINNEVVSWLIILILAIALVSGFAKEALKND